MTADSQHGQRILDASRELLAVARSIENQAAKSALYVHVWLLLALAEQFQDVAPDDLPDNYRPTTEGLQDAE